MPDPPLLTAYTCAKPQSTNSSVLVSAALTISRAEPRKRGPTFPQQFGGRPRRSVAGHVLFSQPPMSSSSSQSSGKAPLLVRLPNALSVCRRTLEPMKRGRGGSGEATIRS
jgi:hypothetical protein